MVGGIGWQKKPGDSVGNEPDRVGTHAPPLAGPIRRITGPSNNCLTGQPDKVRPD